MSEDRARRKIQSFVRREGRLTPGQEHALEHLWPIYGINNAEGLIDFDLLFEKKADKADIVFEIGFGNGESLAEMATKQPGTNFIGIEVHRPGVGRLLNLIEKLQLTNLRVACTDAVELLKDRIPDNSLDRVQLYFPDPWHKKRHHKRRIIQPAFVTLLAKKIKPGGYLHMATDWQHYAQQMLDDLSQNKLFKNCSDDDTYIVRPDYRPQTKFEQRGLNLGHGVWDLLYRRK